MNTSGEPASAAATARQGKVGPLFLRCHHRHAPHRMIEFPPATEERPGESFCHGCLFPRAGRVHPLGRRKRACRRWPPVLVRPLRSLQPGISLLGRAAGCWPLLPMKSLLLPSRRACRPRPKGDERDFVLGAVPAAPPALRAVPALLPSALQQGSPRPNRPPLSYSRRQALISRPCTTSAGQPTASRERSGHGEPPEGRGLRPCHHSAGGSHWSPST